MKKRSIGAYFKLQEGVRVCLLIWDDKTSINSRLMKTNGLMMTHDEDTKHYFRNSQVGPDFWAAEGLLHHVCGREVSTVKSILILFTQEARAALFKVALVIPKVLFALHPGLVCGQTLENGVHSSVVGLCEGDLHVMIWYHPLQQYVLTCLL